MLIHNKYPSLIRLRIEASSRERERESKRRPRHFFKDITSVENLLAAWGEFLQGKRKRRDVARFSIHLMDNILALYQGLLHKTYVHGSYFAFKINDPKPREIHKATVRDRLLHHAIYRILYPYFDQKFIHDSFSCRRGKGTHRAIDQFRVYIRRVSRNHTRTAWVLKCDIRKFFANINHNILLKILRARLPDSEAIDLLYEIITSFHTKNRPGIGLPLGNLTSQLLVNIYLNEFDHFVKRELKIRHYIRYADDFVVVHNSKDYLLCCMQKISSFLETKLKLTLNSDKVFVKTIASGVDFLGWVHFLHHRVPRTAMKRRMFKRLDARRSSESLASYRGLLSHGNTFRLRCEVEMRYGETE